MVLNDFDEMKKVIVWLVLALIALISCLGIWMKIRIDEAPSEINDPGIEGIEDMMPDPGDLPVE